MSSRNYISIIIPVKEINEYIKESVPKILEIDIHNFEFEIIVLPNENNILFNAFKTTIIPTGNVGPAEKRNIGAQHAHGNIIAFLDDDAYPFPNWLSNNLQYLEKEEIAAIGGPGITPSQDLFWAKVSGGVFLTKIGGGNPNRYLPIGNVHEVDDWPSVNLLIKKNVFLSIGGFHKDRWPGEDTKLCNEIVYKLGKKILYIPNMIVYHYRRPGLIKHLTQIGNYGLHRGHFFRQGDLNSKKLKYLIPTLFIFILIVGGLLVIILKGIFLKLYYLFVILYLIILLLGFLDIYFKIYNFTIAFSSVFYIFFTHIVYGIKFLQGFLTTNLKSKFR